LMRAIVGVQRISAGKLDVLGLSAGSKALRAKIGYVTQDPAIYNDLTVLQNLRYFGRLMGAARGQAERIISQVDLVKQTHQLAGTLSGGQRARVSLAIALLGDPALLVMDEPTVGLDPVLRRDLWQLFDHLTSEGKTLLVSSHVMDEAEKCKQLLLLRDGQLLWNGPRRALLQQARADSVEVAFLHLIDQAESA